MQQLPKLLSKNMKYCFSKLYLYIIAFRPLGIGVATGEMCSNRVLFKQFLQANAIEYCQIDSCRIGGINEILAVYLMAAKLNGFVFFTTINSQLFKNSNKSL